MSRTSLKQKLNDLICQRGQISHYDLRLMCENGSFGRIYRASNMERRLRESVDVEAIYEHGVIKFYKWVGTPMVFKEFKVLDEKGNVEKVIKVASN